ncbi:hypothetical protein HWV07_04300 [Natronomonas salina]|uniref:hypothetical protein n=1 Tax=Natronomonas salina TaxID=1710540 RepID=UPI0015B6FED1|nr:hypothetical protein [Natronomonas salina]QLD88295.1 hypothetical protein HWV07_04300 [Natronomonas salina]
MASLRDDEKLALKAIIIELVVFNSGMFKAGHYISDIDNVVDGYSLNNIENMAEELNGSYNWVNYKAGHINISNKNKAKEKLKELREESFSSS